MRILITLVICFCAITSSILAESSDDSREYQELLFKAIETGNVTRVEQLIQNQDVNVANHKGQTALHLAAEMDNEAIVITLLANGADVNAVDNEGVSALQWAALSQDEKITEILLSRGATINTDRFRRTALYFAAYNTNEKIAELLIRNGANVHIAKSGSHATPLHIATLYGGEKVVEVFLNNNVNVNVVDVEGYTPLYYAVLRGTYSHIMSMGTNGPRNSFKKLVEYSILQNRKDNPVKVAERIANILIKYGANINHKSNSRETPLDIAIYYDNRIMIEYLTENGAKKGDQQR